MKILVTGANGQLGNEIKALSNGFSQFEFFFHDIDTLDLTNEFEVEKFISDLKPQFIINCAAYTAVDKAEEETDLAFKINRDVPGFLSKVSLIKGIKFIHISTDYVFDGKNYLPYKESDPMSPNSIYGKSKAEGENKVKESPNSIIIRTSWLYSSYNNNFVKTMLRLSETKESLSVIYDQIGSPTYARDLARVILEIINQSGQNENNFKPGIYHYSNEGVCSWYDFAIEIFTISGIKIPVLPIETFQYPTPAKRPHYSVMNKSKIKQIYGITIPYWKNSLSDCLKLILS